MTEALRLVEELGLSNVVIYMDQVPQQRLSQVYTSADAVIRAGYVESFSFTVVEGMAAGLPVIASDIRLTPILLTY